MKVKELIELLHKQNPNAVVTIKSPDTDDIEDGYCVGYTWDIESMELFFDKPQEMDIHVNHMNEHNKLQEQQRKDSIAKLLQKQQEEAIKVWEEMTGEKLGE